MGVYVKGFKMPKGCLTCKLLDYYDGYRCIVTQMLVNSFRNGERSADCPLVEIPPHGRLIDADAIPYNKIMLEDDDFYYGVTMPYIDRMPTIIEAEEDE